MHTNAPQLWLSIAEDRHVKILSLVQLNELYILIIRHFSHEFRIETINNTLSEFSLSWPSARNELNMTHLFVVYYFFHLLFSVAKLISSSASIYGE